MEKLIDLVKERPLLYDNRNVDFKYREKRLEGWNEIAQIMGKEDGNFWRFKWNCLKENYSKYKKVNFNPSHQIYKKYRNWPWGERMKFMDNIPNKRKGKYKSNTKVKAEESLESVDNNDIVITKITETQIEPQIEFSNVEISDLFHIPETNEISINNTVYKHEKTSSYEENIDHPDERIHILIQNGTESTDSSINKNLISEKKRKKNEFDEVEHFFMSYAQTFKRLPARFQQVLKLEMVTLFARYELQAQNYEKNM